MTEIVQIDNIAAGGAGVGRLADGRAVFVHRTAPGDHVEARIVESRRRWARGVAIGVERPGPGRRSAPCPHYDRCGGCTLEHLGYPDQLGAKGAMVAAALERIGGWPAVDRIPVIASPLEFRYRNRISITLLRLGGDRVVAGFHELERPGRIVDVGAGCLLPEAPLGAILDSLREGWGPGARLLPGGPRLRLTLRMRTDGSAALLVEGGRGAGSPEELLARVPGLSEVWHGSAGADDVVRVAASGQASPCPGEDAGSGSGPAFRQVNSGVAKLVRAYVLQRIGDVRGSTVVDAYAGTGVFGRALAKRGASVTAIERDARAVQEGRAGAPDGLRFVQGMVEERLPGSLPADLAVVNPPRAGLHPDVVDALASAPPPRLVYVSCDPATLARDLARLRNATPGGVRLLSVRAFDMFPQTAHVETVVEVRCGTT